MAEDIQKRECEPRQLGPQERLWFEYLSKLNDRELQTQRASGSTSWLLLAVVAAIVYRGLSGLQGFLSIPHAVTTTAVVGVLL
jgi:hypothetical protein